MVLSLLIWIPLIGALTLLPFSSTDQVGDDLPVEADVGTGWISRFGILRLVALGWSTFALMLAICALTVWDPGIGTLQLVENIPWIPALGITYGLGLDGISAYLVLLTAALMPLVILSSWGIKKQLKGYLISMLVLESAMLGTLLATDLFLFYLFWELMLAPMYFIIGIWGGKRRVYATVKFVLYTVFGSVLMLVALLFTVWKGYQGSGEISFSLAQLMSFSQFTVEEELWLFLCFALAFGIKVPIFPFHTWLPDAHVEAPTGGSVVLAGVLLKMGLYGFIRFAYPLFPRAAEIAAPLIGGLAVIGIIYGALVAWVQHDMKKLVAYSSVSHLGYCVLGFFAFNPLSVSGSIIQMVNHGISTGALFLLVGVLYERTHSREIAAYSGLADRLPAFALIFVVFTLSSIAVPLTNGFVGEFMILAGSFQGSEVFAVLTGLALLGVILSAVYMLTLTQRILFGEYKVLGADMKLSDLATREFVVLAPLLFFVFYIGLNPKPMIRSLQPTLESYFAEVQQRANKLPPSKRQNLPNKEEDAVEMGGESGEKSAIPAVVARSQVNHTTANSGAESTSNLHQLERFPLSDFS